MGSRTVRVLVTFSLGLLVALRAADAQPQRPIPVIGVLANDDLSAALANPKSPVSALRQGLREMGYIEGYNMVMEYRPQWRARSRAEGESLMGEPLLPVVLPPA